jgi:hypothetical protein
MHFRAEKPRVTTQNASQFSATPTVVREANLRKLEPLTVEEFPAPSRAQLPNQRNAFDGNVPCESLPVSTRVSKTCRRITFFTGSCEDRKEIGIERERKRTANSWDSVSRSRCRAMISPTCLRQLLRRRDPGQGLRGCPG